MRAATLSHRNERGRLGKIENLPRYQRIVEDDVGVAQEPDGADRQKVLRTGAGAHEIDSARLAHASVPAATVRLLAGSMRMNAPVTRLREYGSTLSARWVLTRTRPMSFMTRVPVAATG